MSAVVSKTRNSGESNILGGASVIISSSGRNAEYGFSQHGGTRNVETCLLQQRDTPMHIGRV